MQAQAQPQFHNLVLSGASTRVPAILGAYAAAEERGLTRALVTYVGSSAGALVAMLLCLSMTPGEVRQVLHDGFAEYERGELDMDSLINAYYAMGVDDGSLLLAKLRAVLQARLGMHDATFLEFAKATGKHLVVCVSNVTTSRPEYWSVDTMPDLSVLTAVRASVALPFIFTPVILDGNVYCDGGIFDHFPLSYIDHGATPFCNTLGICVDHEEKDKDTGKDKDIGRMDTTNKAKCNPPTDIFGFAVGLLLSMVSRINAQQHQSAAAQQRKKKTCLVCELPAAMMDDGSAAAGVCGFDYESMRFRISVAALDRLYNLGHSHMMQLLDERQTADVVIPSAHADVASDTNCCSCSSETLPTCDLTSAPAPSSTSTVG